MHTQLSPSSTSICVNPILSAEHLPPPFSMWEALQDLYLLFLVGALPAAAPQHHQDSIQNNGETNNDPEIQMRLVSKER